MDIVKSHIVDARKFLLTIREQHYELEELKYERYLEEYGLCINVSNPARACISTGGSNDLSNIPVHIEQFMEQIVREEATLYQMRSQGKELISMLPDARGRAILKYYYIDFLTWEQVAMRIHLSPSRTFSSHRLALDELNQIIRTAWQQRLLDTLKIYCRKKDSSKQELRL